MRRGIQQPELGGRIEGNKHFAVVAEAGPELEVAEQSIVVAVAAAELEPEGVERSIAAAVDAFAFAVPSIVVR